MSPAAEQLVRFVVPIMALWFLIGLFVTVFYHLSLFFVFGEFRNPDELLLDLMMTALRVPLYFFAWPVVLYFDQSALHSIRLFWRWLEPKNRQSDEELRAVLEQRNRYRLVRQSYAEAVRRRSRRQRELATGAERARRTRRLSADSPELDDIRILIGIGSGSEGNRQLINLFPDAVLAEEVNEETESQLRMRRQWRCVRCGSEIESGQIRLPEPFFLEVIENGKPLISGWAYQGKFRVEFRDCPKCGLKGPVLEEPFSVFCRASEVVAAVRSGVNFAPEEPEPVFNRIMFIRPSGVVSLLVGLLGLVAVLLVLGVCIWAVVFFITYFRNLRVF
jgi:hypothetical protein